MKARHKRIAVLVLGLCGLTTAVGLALSAFNDNLVFFFSPSQVVAGKAPIAQSFRIGGLVAGHSLRRGADGLTAYFTITDTAHSVPVAYSGILPDLFKEGRGCVAQGRMGADRLFHAELVLAKHDENYMPVEAAQSLEQASRSSNRAAKTFRDR
jgi:cytochrome c-type biogenesis protein CcmE